MAIDREVQEVLNAIQLDLTEIDDRLEFAERRVRAIRHQNFIENFLQGGVDPISEFLDFKLVSSPANPPSTFIRIFADTDNSDHLTQRSSGGIEIDLAYLDADAIAAVEGEATLDLTGDVTIAGTKSLKVDVIDEKDSAAGVTIENVTIKDGTVEFHHGTDTISSDEIISPTGGYIIAAAAALGVDNLDGIGGGANGRIIVVRADAGDTITIRHNDAGGGTGRKLLTNDNAAVALVGNDDDTITFMYDESLDSANGAWFEISRGDSGSAHTKYTDAEAISAVEGEATLDLTGALTAVSYGGITEANLVDKSAAETIAGLWDFGTQGPKADVIAESTAAAGVTIDSVLLKDGVVAVGDVDFDDATSDPLAASLSNTAADGSENSVARKDHVHPWSPPACHAYNSGSLTVSNSVGLSVPFDSERFDNDGMHSTSTNTSRVTVKTAGKYLVVGILQWASNINGRRALSLRLNGNNIVAGQQQSAVATDNASASVVWDMAVDDYFEIRAFQISGGNLDLTANKCGLMLVWVSD